MRIPEQKIEEVRHGANIVDVISSFVQLKKRGNNFIGLCPFHSEKTPSFTVSSEKQIFHCFGCHQGGNVFKFLMEYKRISFIESVKEIADQVGISIDYDEKYDPKAQSEQELLYDINVHAARFFSNNLLKSDEGSIGREYFKKRNIKTNSIMGFGLGYAKNSWDDFKNYAEKNNLDPEKCKTIGLLDTKDEGGYYDKFRGRIIFPIMSPNGRVIAFGGRILDNSKKTAKYLNSPESKIYKKRFSLYGLYHSQDEIRRMDKAILVEGYMDLISLYQAGIKNVVASSGTALTNEQVQLLSRYTKNIVVMFDADIAGQKAAMRSIETLLKQDFDVKILSLPEGEDPDSYVNKHGKVLFEEKINQATEFLEYQTAQFEKQGLFKDASTQSTAIRQMVQTAALVSDKLKRSILLKKISKKFNLREKLLETELNKFISENERRNNPAPPPPLPGYSEPLIETDQNTTNSPLFPVEKEIIKLLFSGSEHIIGFIFDYVSPDGFSHAAYKKIAQIIFEEFEKDVYSPSAIIDKFTDDSLRTLLLDLTISEEAISKKWDELSASGRIAPDLKKQTIDTVVKYRVLKLDAMIKRHTAEISKAKDELQMLQLMKEMKNLQNEKKELLMNKTSMSIN